MSPRPLDVYPASLSVAGEVRFPRVRVFTDSKPGSRVVVFGRVPETDGQIQQLAEAVVATVEHRTRRSAPHRITTADGEIWEVLKAGDCGCGDPLKRFNIRQAMR